MNNVVFKSDCFRRNLEDFFRPKGEINFSKLANTPFIVFIYSKEKKETTVELCFTPNELISNYHKECDVLCRLSSGWGSDYFLFKVGDAIKYQKMREKELKVILQQIKEK